ncbi:MAG: hypothetical protein ACETWG_03270, partial [Candidatus Neomarinimicrobiota bacterium]
MQVRTLVGTILVVVFVGVHLESGLQAQKASRAFPEIPPSVLPVARMDYDDGQDPMGSRLFRTTSTRTQINLSGFWDFVLDPDSTGEEKGYATNFPEPETRQWVPGT